MNSFIPAGPAATWAPAATNQTSESGLNLNHKWTKCHLRTGLTDAGRLTWLWTRSRRFWPDHLEPWWLHAGLSPLFRAAPSGQCEEEEPAQNEGETGLWSSEKDSRTENTMPSEQTTGSTSWTPPEATAGSCFGSPTPAPSGQGTVLLDQFSCPEMFCRTPSSGL